MQADFGTALMPFLYKLAKRYMPFNKTEIETSN
jgi:hypothetical protein